VVFSVELDMLYGGLVQVKRVSCPVLAIESDADAQRVYDDFEKEFAEAFRPARDQQARRGVHRRDHPQGHGDH